jgi:hypothetical protein
VAGLDAVGTNHHFLYPAIAHGTHLLKVGVETAFGNIVGMADIIANHRLFAAYFTHSGHSDTPNKWLEAQKIYFYTIKEKL